MTTDLTVAPRTAHDSATPAGAPRFDLYGPIHKALRLFMVETLVRVGRLDVDDDAERAATLAQMDALLTFCRAHVRHESDHLHPALEARQAASSARASADHIEHLHAIADLRDEIVVLRGALPAQRPALAARLYRHLTLFIAENFQHMQVEETAHNACLWAHYDDGRLAAIHDRIVASLSDAEHLEVARWMVPALTPAERAVVLGGVQAAMPPEAFRVVLDTVRPHLDTTAWAKLGHALGIAPAPGLVRC